MQNEVFIDVLNTNFIFGNEKFEDLMLARNY